MIVTARFIIPMDAPPIENGAIQFRDGIITAVGKKSEIAPQDGEECVDYGDAVILPGFVNAHTHLELTGFASVVSPSVGFIDWLRSLVAARDSKPPNEIAVRAAVQNGISQSLSAGVTTIGDISLFSYWTRPVIRESSLRCVSFGEVVALGTRRHLFDERLSTAVSRECESDRLRIGVSPHAPYTVEPTAMRTCSEKANELHMPLCIHLAETPEEAEFTRSASGPFREFLESIGLWDDGVPTPGMTPVDLAAHSGLLTSRTLIAHGNYVSADDIATIASRGSSVAYCPRTHTAFHHAPHLFMRMREVGINVCVGTDSLASNPSLSVLEELRFLRQSNPSLDPLMLIEMGTLAGAKALGMQNETGSLSVGKKADLVVLGSADMSYWTDVLDRETSIVSVYTEGRQSELP